VCSSRATGGGDSRVCLIGTPDFGGRRIGGTEGVGGDGAAGQSRVESGCERSWCRSGLGGLRTAGPSCGVGREDRSVGGEAGRRGRRCGDARGARRQRDRQGTARTAEAAWTSTRPEGRAQTREVSEPSRGQRASTSAERQKSNYLLGILIFYHRRADQQRTH
jgi:hypothetical protein